MCERLAFFHVVVGHKGDETNPVGVRKCIMAVRPCITGDNSRSVRELLRHCVDNLGLDLMPQVVVRDMEIGGKAHLVESGVENHSSTDPIRVEVWHDGDLFVGRS